MHPSVICRRKLSVRAYIQSRTLQRCRASIYDTRVREHVFGKDETYESRACVIGILHKLCNQVSTFTIFLQEQLDLAFQVCFGIK